MPGRRILSLMLLAAVCTTLCAQANKTKTFTVRVFDGKTGTKVVPDNIRVRINHHSTTSLEWVKLVDDGSAVVTIPAEATVLSVRATYDDGIEYYVNCDVARQHDSSQETWYPLADVLTQGLVIPNECGKALSAADLKIEVKPGEFVLLVRKRGFRD
jgi:hypothetical protein